MKRQSIQGLSDLPGQNEIPGTEGNETQWLAGYYAKVSKPAKAQLPCDIGLFSDEANQTDLVDLLQK